MCSGGAGWAKWVWGQDVRLRKTNLVKVCHCADDGVQVIYLLKLARVLSVKVVIDCLHIMGTGDMCGRERHACRMAGTGWQLLPRATQCTAKCKCRQ